MAKSNGELMAKMEAKKPAAPVAMTPADGIGVFLAREDVKSQIAAALPKHMTADRLARIALTTIRLNPTLLECSVPSLMSCIMQSAQLGLEPGLLGHCYLVPFNRKVKENGQERWIRDVQFIIGYRGLLDLARRSGEIKEIAAHPIYEHDEFELEYGFNSKLRHVPAHGDRGKVVGYYGYAQTLDGGRFCEFMSLADVEAIRQRSKAKDNGPWVTDPIEMGRKTVLRRLCKYLPLSIEVAEHIAADEQKEYADATAISLNLGGPTPPAPQALPEPAQILLPDAENYTEEEIAALTAEAGAVQTGA